jgi:hypothetical protein
VEQCLFPWDGKEYKVEDNDGKEVEEEVSCNLLSCAVWPSHACKQCVVHAFWCAASFLQVGQSGHECGKVRVYQCGSSSNGGRGGILGLLLFLFLVLLA